MSLSSIHKENQSSSIHSEKDEELVDNIKWQDREIQEMINNYWPWSLSKSKPRGHKNLRHDGLFPNTDYVKAKRLSSPVFSNRTGRPAVRGREHSVIRNNLKNTLNNQIRIKFNPEQQDDYRKELERQINERKLTQQLEKKNDLEFYQKTFLLNDDPWGKPGPGGRAWRPSCAVGLNFLKSLGWSTDKMMEDLERQRAHYREMLSREYEKYRTLSVYTLSEDNKNEKVNLTKNNNKACGQIKLSPITRTGNGNQDLVQVLAKHRFSTKIPLSTTDVTRGFIGELKSPGKMYLSELENQISFREQTIKKTKCNEEQEEIRHFNVLDKYWGRPGHGAPQMLVKKGCLNCLLYNGEHSKCRL